MASLCSALQGVPIGWPDWPTHVSHPELGLPAHWLVVERETLQRLQRVGSSWHLRWCKSPRLGGWNPMTSKLVNKKLLTGDPKKTASFFFSVPQTHWHLWHWPSLTHKNGEFHPQKKSTRQPFLGPFGHPMHDSRGSHLLEDNPSLWEVDQLNCLKKTGWWSWIIVNVNPGLINHGLLIRGVLLQ